jgi:ribonucleoside-diphosphate reductase alpha chain
VEVSAKQLLAASQAFQKALDEIAKAAAVPVLTATPAVNAAAPRFREAQDLNAPPRACATGCRRSARRSRTSSPSPGTRATSPSAVSQRPAGRDLHPHGQGGIDGFRLMDAFATSVSLALQHGVPLKVLCEKFAHTRFEPSGWTGNEQIGYAKSLMDYIFRWLNLRFLSGSS